MIQDFPPVRLTPFALGNGGSCLFTALCVVRQRES